MLDEFPFLAKASPELPSLLQRALGPQGCREGGPVRLLLCGSALSFMGNLLSGTALLRGRASLELVVPTLDCRMVGRFWGVKLLIPADEGRQRQPNRSLLPGLTSNRWVCCPGTLVTGGTPAEFRGR